MSPITLSLLAFILSAGLLTMAPGLDTANVLRASTVNGPRVGFATVIGVCIGLLIWGTSAALGLTALFAASAMGFLALKWIGAAYLLYLGVQLVFKPRSAFEKPAGEVKRSKNVLDGFRSGLLTNLLNPKAGFFYLTFLPQFIPHGVNVEIFSLGLTLTHALIALTWFSLLIVMTIPLGKFLSKPKVVRWMDRLTGGLFIGFGLKLATAD